MNHCFCFLRVAAFGLVLAGSSAWAQSTAFTYQGELKDAGGPVTGACDFQFELLDAGNAVLATDSASGVTVSEGLFTAQVDFSGAANFDGSDRNLRISVDCDGDSTFTQVAVQPISPGPYSITSYSTEALQGVPVDEAAPSDGQVLKFDSTSNAWEPAADSSGSGDITAVTPGNGLTGGGTSGDVTLGADTTVLQARVSGACTGGDKVVGINADGTVNCGADTDTDTDTNTGDLTVQGGNFISGSGGSGTVTLDLDAITCATGEYIESINADGTVTCSPDDAPSVTGREIATTECTFEETSVTDPDNLSPTPGVCIVVATCPTGKVAVGGGGRIPCSRARLFTTLPAGTDSWQVGGFYNGSSCQGSEPIELTAYAVCVDAN